MTFGKNVLFSALVGIGLLDNVLGLAHVNFLGTTTVISFCTCILLPGFLISLILRIGKISFWENLFIVVGLSIAFLEFGGLLLNILLPLAGVKDPLASQNLVIGFDVYIVLLFIIAWFRTKQFVTLIRLPKFSRIEKVWYILPIFFPIFAVFGAIVLNNGGSNILTLILLGSIAFYSFLLVIFRSKIAVSVYPYTLFFIAVASIFTTSLRSWYITGHDIEVELYVFRLTNTHHIWSMAFFRDPYNACLSITILPTVLVNLLSIQDIYVYKVIFQILFATAPVLVFYIVKSYTAAIMAFLSAFLFMSFPTFITDMAMLNRQEIAFIFFGLLLYLMLNRSEEGEAYPQVDTLPLAAFPASVSEVDTLPLAALPAAISQVDMLSSTALPLSRRRLLFVIFALSVVVSHYSTNFVLVSLIAFVYISTLIISLSLVKNILASLLFKVRITHKKTFGSKTFLSLPLVLILFGGTYLWNNLYTHSSNNVSSVIGEVVSSVFVTSNATKSSDLSSSIFFAAVKKDPQQELQDYIKSIRQTETPQNTYSEAVVSKYPTYLAEQEQLAPTPLGNLLTSFHISVFALQSELRKLAAYFMQIFVLVGLAAIFFLKKEKSLDLQFLLLCFGSLMLLALITVLPFLSVEYGVLRMFQQFLFILSLPIMFGISSIFFFVKEQKRTLFTGVVAVFFFLNLTGFISHLTGDYYPQLNLDNAGLYYDIYYVHRSDVLAIVWLSKNGGKNELIQADVSGINKMPAYGGIHAVDENFPATVQRNAYIYLNTSSSVEISYGQDALFHSSDKSFLDDNKNVVYSNGMINIYK